MAAAKKNAAFSIDTELLRRLEERVPETERSQFVEDALAKALGKSERKVIADKIRASELVDGGSGESADILRRLRDERMQYISGRD